LSVRGLWPRRAVVALGLLAAAVGCIESVSVRDAGVSACGAGLTRCDLACVNPQTSVAHCGACGRACVGAQSCTDGVCTCPSAQHLFAGACIPDRAPRPVAPLSLGDVTQRRPTLRWTLPQGFDGAVVELCRDRACEAVIETRTVTGTSAQPTLDLPARTVVFWRLRARAGTTTDTVYSPTWLFHVPARSASGAVDTSFNAHLDVNADGFDDVAVGAANIASAFVYLGDSGATPLSGAPVGLSGPAGSAFGDLVTSAGDVNGDGYGDLLVGAALDSPGGRYQAGSASVFLGSAAGITTTAAVVLAGVDSGDRFGVGMSAGDLNGDGYSDVVVGSYLADPGGRVDAGTVSVFHGSPAGIPSTAAIVLAGGAADDYLGAGTGAGDVDGDGYADLVVGALHASPSRRGWAGTASVFHGSASGIAPTAARVLEGVTENGLSASVAVAGDLNGDGYADLVVGAPNGASAGGVRTGTASVFHGSAEGIPATAARLLQGAAGGDYFGHLVAGAGDVNGDGYGDLVVGSLVASPSGRHQAGTASVFHGSAAGIAATAAVVLEGTSALDRFASGLAAGDLNGDGYSDVVVGAHLASPGGRANAGTASVFLGADSGLAESAATVLEGAARNGGFGTSVARREAHSIGIERRSHAPGAGRGPSGGRRRGARAGRASGGAATTGDAVTTTSALASARDGNGGSTGGATVATTAARCHGGAGARVRRYVAAPASATPASANGHQGRARRGGGVGGATRGIAASRGARTVSARTGVARAGGGERAPGGPKASAQRICVRSSAKGSRAAPSSCTEAKRRDGSRAIARSTTASKSSSSAGSRSRGRENGPLLIFHASARSEPPSKGRCPVLPS
jgi:hypothetical protein